MDIFNGHAKGLPLNIKIQILIHLPYEDVMFITDTQFWAKYWENYNLLHKTIKDGVFSPNPEQTFVLKLIESGKNVFINSPAGTGKSALIKHFFNENRTKKIIGLTSTTGISALNIGGSTLHSFLGIGLGKDDVDDLYDKIIRCEEKRNLWLKLNVLVIDEVSMLHPDLFKKLEKLARKLRENEHRFGGIQLVVSGDLFQLPCISQDSTLIISSSKFKKCIDNVIELRNIVRQKDYLFKTVLNKIRKGVVDQEVKNVLKTRFIKPEIHKIKPTRLFCTRKSVDHLNEKELNKLANEGYEFREYLMEFVNLDCPISFDYVTKNFIKNSTTPSTLQLCEKAQVLLTYNISPTLVNGSRGVITGFTSENYPIVEFIMGTTSIIKPIKFTLDYTLRNGKNKMVGYALQIPLKIAYALTVHSCQGSTLDCVSIDLRNTFEYGQAYTAMSRVGSLEGLYLKKFNYDVIQAHPDALRFKA
jgi:ATP-dependent DNA helicase PIF1